MECISTPLAARWVGDSLAVLPFYAVQKTSQ
jgi:hypothetical protein